MGRVGSQEGQTEQRPERVTKVMPTDPSCVGKNVPLGGGQELEEMEQGNRHKGVEVRVWRDKEVIGRKWDPLKANGLW